MTYAYACPERCPECNSRFRETATENGLLRQCTGCTVRQWCDDDGKPRGTPANVFTRQVRQRAHAAFDQLWKNGHVSREEAYSWLARELHVESAHIGEMTTEQCLEVERLSNNELTTRRAKIRRAL